jgi:hypothetical protein
VAGLVRARGGRTFTAIVPESLLRDGVKRVQVLGVARRGSGVRLVPLGAVGGDGVTYKLDEAGIRGPGGRRFRLDEDAAVGYVDKSVTEDEEVTLSGWAIDRRVNPVEQIVGFVDGRLAFNGPPSLPRADVARGGAPDNLGFSFDLPEDRLGRQRPQVFALAGGAATPLGWTCSDAAHQDIGC